MRIKKILSIAINTTPQILLKEALRKYQDKKKETFLRKKTLSGDLSISDVAFLNSLVDVGDFEAFACKKREDKVYLLANYKEIRRIIENNFSESKKEIIHWADEIYSHRFDILGSGKIDLVGYLKERGEQDGSYLPWHWDFKNGFKWDRKMFYRDINFGKIKGQDVKVPWELSRFQHLVPLGQAYVLIGDEKYTREFIKEVDNWIDCNPYLLGVNWACTMDVAIRVANWLIAWSFFRKSQLITDDFIKGFFKSILQHGRFIRENLEWSELLTSNHYLSNIVGLLFLGILVPEFKESEEWKGFALKELVKEMEKQVYEDGTDFEASTCYHRLVLEFFFCSALLCKMNGVDLPSGFVEKLKRMFDCALYALKPDGRMPQIGDNDNGRFLRFEPPDTEVLDLRYLFPLAALYFDEPAFKVDFKGGMNEKDLPDYVSPAFWLFGEKGLERWLKMPLRRVEELASRAFTDAGWYVIRNKRDYMIISCGPNGLRDTGGHAHNDKLSFELSIDGKDVIVDPGTYVYTPLPEERNIFRSTNFHNTVFIDEQEQNRFYEDNVFGLSNDTKCRCLVFEDDGDKILFEGVHYGYRRLKDGIIHKRRIVYDKRGRRWKIEDEISGGNSTPHELKWRLCMHPKISVWVGKDGVIKGDGFSISTSPSVEMKIEEGWYSKGYGSKELTQTIVFDRKKQIMPFNLTITIEHYRKSM